MPEEVNDDDVIDVNNTARSETPRRDTETTGETSETESRTLSRSLGIILGARLGRTVDGFSQPVIAGPRRAGGFPLTSLPRYTMRSGWGVA